MDVLEDYVSPPSLPRPLDGSPGVTAVARANGISGPVAHKLRNYLRQKALKMDAFIAELVKASEYCGAKHVQEALVTTLGIDALESITLLRVLVPKDNNERRNSNASSVTEPSTTKQVAKHLSSTIPLKYQVVVKKVAKPDAIKINKWYTCGLKGAVKDTTDVVDLKKLGKRWMAALFQSLTGDSLSKVQQEDKATYDAVYDALKAKLQNAMANHQSEKKKSDFFKAIGLTTADKAKLETVATLDAVGATKLFKEWVTAHVEVSTQPAGQANVMETQQEPLGQKSSRQDGDEGDDGDYSGDEGEGREDDGEGGEDEGEGREDDGEGGEDDGEGGEDDGEGGEDDGEGGEDDGEGGEDDGEGGEDDGEGECAEDEGGEDEGGEDGDWPYESGDYMGGEDEDWEDKGGEDKGGEDKGGEDEGGEDEGGDEDEGTGGKVLFEEYGRSKSQKVHSKSVPQPTGRRKVLVTGQHDKGALDARGRPTRLRQPSAKARESQETVAMVVPARTKRPRPKETPLVLPEDPSAFGATVSNPAKRKESFGVGNGRAVQTHGAKVQQEKGKKAMAEIRKGGLKKQRR
ncbi:hypothetical protein VOLCADRAFT_107292 [Volvox carteri f. nagariensis]|uniref:Uncharacterized protein n=1 Tax=Volvox carteri f. nagariensis TaxID=3068 RepID=D8UD15_VOLCA|nr:uncharacterized protein VOLCADRAFT_107292 [Volvox carteri f. nagariensis]EFJ42351.1 hypothetical protein VOLCADRAFT_107292 [Volvox carteri f. nagariensis]|eukprot:XP_002956584.1 hypothetical protein VOLCADRAFT_107292 [Volvox carteri f. nagariensis]